MDETLTDRLTEQVRDDTAAQGSDPPGAAAVKSLKPCAGDAVTAVDDGELAEDNNLHQMSAAEADHSLTASSETCTANLIPEYGVIHLKNALTEQEQRTLWARAKPHVRDPAGKATGFSAFAVSSGKSNRDKVFDEFGKLLFERSAEELVKQMPKEEDRLKELAYKRLSQIHSGTKPVSLNCVAGNYYRPDAILANHCDMDKPFFTMSVALGDDIEFTVGKKTKNPWKNERSGRGKTFVMKSGDAVFFDGGSIPHEVGGIVKGTAPSWWAGTKVKNGARCVVLFREDI